MTASGTGGPVVLERHGRVAEVVLNRPECRNALSAQAIAALTTAFRDLADPDVGAVLVRGSGDFFCAGLDVREFDPSDPPLARWIATHRALAEVPAPVIACLAGGAINAGAALALAADLLVAGESAYLRIREAEMGMVPTVNAAWLAARHPASVGLQLALSCRAFPADELHRLGIALDVVPDADLLAHARRLAAQLAAFPAAARTKRVLGAARAGDRFQTAAAAALTAGAAP